MNNNSKNIEIGERIRSVRENMLLSREKFSECIDISEVFLGQIERGESSLSLKTLDSIVSFTGVSTDFILYGNETENSYVKKIDKILKHCSDDTICFIYKMINELYLFTKNKKSNKE